VKRWFAILVCILGSSLAVPLTTIYDQLLGTLQQAQRLEGQNPVEALTLISQAENRFRLESAQMDPALRTGVLTALEDAKTAIARKSPVDLQARVLLIRGILAKALYDAYFADLASGQRIQAIPLLSRLIAASGFPPSILRSIDQEETHLAALRALFQRLYAQNILQALLQARKAGRDAAYLAVTRAYALYLVIQDAPAAQALTPQAFVGALEALVAHHTALFQQDLLRLIQTTQALLGTSHLPSPTPLAQYPKPPTPAQGGGGHQASIPSSLPPLADQAPTLPNPSLFTLRLPPLERRTLLEGLQRLGLSLSSWQATLEEVAGLVGAAQGLSQANQLAQARRELSSALHLYRTVIEPPLIPIAPSLSERIDRLLASAEASGGLSPEAFGVLQGQLQEVQARLSGTSLPLSNLFAHLELALPAPIPKVLFLVLALLSLIPLSLLRLAFGGRSLYWRYLGLSLFFLLLPGILEGLSSLSILARTPGLAFFGVFGLLSITSNPLLSLIWALTLALAILFSSLGLRGIALQLGLLTKTTAGPKPARATKSLSGETLVEWDEEL